MAVTNCSETDLIQRCNLKYRQGQTQAGSPYKQTEQKDRRQRQKGESKQAKIQNQEHGTNRENAWNCSVTRLHRE